MSDFKPRIAVKKCTFLMPLFWIFRLLAFKFTLADLTLYHKPKSQLSSTVITFKLNLFYFYVEEQNLCHFDCFVCTQVLFEDNSQLLPLIVVANFDPLVFGCDLISWFIVVAWKVSDQIHGDILLTGTHWW